MRDQPDHQTPERPAHTEESEAGGGGHERERGRHAGLDSGERTHHRCREGTQKRQSGNGFPSARNRYAQVDGNHRVAATASGFNARQSGTFALRPA